MAWDPTAKGSTAQQDPSNAAYSGRGSATSTTITKGTPSGGLTFFDRSTDPNAYSYPGKVINSDPQRQVVVIANTGLNPVQVAFKNTDNSDFNSPSVAQWTAGEVIPPGQERYSPAGAQSVFLRANVSGQAVSGYIYLKVAN